MEKYGNTEDSQLCGGVIVMNPRHYDCNTPETSPSAVGGFGVDVASAGVNFSLQPLIWVTSVVFPVRDTNAEQAPADSEGREEKFPPNDVQTKIMWKYLLCHHDNMFLCSSAIPKKRLKE